MTLTLTASPKARVRRFAVSLSALVVAAGVLQGAFGKMRSWYERQEPLVVARCEVKCWSQEERNLCIKNCLHKGPPKPGQCPSKDTQPTFPQLCSRSCQKDSHCKGVTKCCFHSCGSTCQVPLNLNTIQGLPSIPTAPRVIEGRRKRTVHIEWTPSDTHSEEKNLLYLIEERNHPGKYFDSNLLTEWHPCSKSYKTSRLIKNLVKPGRWYQFRIAAINENGTRGYSENSLPFKSSASPKPPKSPQNVTVGPLLKSNGKLSTVLKWSPPESDLPIQKYKVFWSRRLQGAKELDSVLVHQQTVPKDTTEFLLRDLQPKSQYFLQVQGLLMYGKERLRGEKSGLVLNTTDFITDNDNALVVERTNDNQINGLHLTKLVWKKKGLKARIVWKPAEIFSKYMITWWSNPCGGPRGFKHCKFSAITKTTYFDLYDLQFNYRYKVNVKKIVPEGKKSKQDTYVTFTTPKCPDFKRNHKKVICT